MKLRENRQVIGNKKAPMQGLKEILDIEYY